MKNLLITFLLLPILLPGISSATYQSHTYRETTGGKSKDFKWEILEKGAQVVITSSRVDEKFINICTPDGATLRWHIQLKPDTDLQAERIANTITLRGRFQGKKVDKSITIDDRPWFQPLSFSLRNLACSDSETLSFWTIRMDTLELVDMQANNRGVEPIQLTGEEVKACKVEIRRNGFFAALWSANYWFRTSDNTFIQYRGTHGLPGTPETRVTLLNQKINRSKRNHNISGL